MSDEKLPLDPFEMKQDSDLPKIYTLEGWYKSPNDEAVRNIKLFTKGEPILPHLRR